MAVEYLNPDTAYARWAESYPPRPHNRLMEVEQAAMLELLPDVTSLTVLDAGCGTGRYLRLCADRGATVLGLDRSAPMLGYARAISPRIVCGGLCEVPLQTGSVDVIVCGLALGDLEDLNAALGELARVLRPGGIVIYSVVHPDGARHGWSRSFDVGGRRCAVKTYWHTPDDHRRACAAAGLDIDAWREPFLEETPDMPVALVVRARTADSRRKPFPPSREARFGETRRSLGGGGHGVPK
jgi:malonyl-CoA O-methyltransferase